MKNLKKISNENLKKIQGGAAPKCCLDWDPKTKNCSQWDFNCLP